MRRIATTCLCLAVFAAAAKDARAQNRPPVIQHQPVTVAVRGQPLIVRARVIDDRGAVKSVKLFCAPSRDAAPFEIPMEASGGGVFIAAIPAALIAGAETIAYYIEAGDDQDNAAETPWHRVPVRAPGPADPVGAAAADSGRPRWVVPALVAGGAAVVVGGAVYAANRGGSDGGTVTPAPDLAGTYTGTVTLIVQDPGAPPDVTTRAAGVTVTEAGQVSSDSLREGALLAGTLSGANFTLTADVSETDVTGQIIFRGTIVDGRVLGTIEGTRTTTAGAGTYAGSFTLQRP